jgi:hypothetical protein
MTITKRNKIHRKLATTYARLSRYLGTPGETPGETETHAEYVTRTQAEYESALAKGVPELHQAITAARATINSSLHQIGTHRIGLHRISAVAGKI